MSLTPEELTAIVIVVVLAVVVAALLLFLVQRLRRRKAQLLHELKDRPELVQDRAYNRLVMARREAELLAARGIDVSRARDLIAQAQAAFDGRSYERAYSSAQLAHESLVHAQRDRALPSTGGAKPVVLASSAPPARPAPAAASPTATGIPKNRAESKFQLSLLNQDLERARGERPGASGTVEAMAIARQAQMAFDRDDFTEAFRLALRGRRALGGAIESLPPRPTPSSEATTEGPSASVPRPPDAGRTAERVASGDRCPACGFPALEGDTYCRGCGAPRASPSCPKCGASRTGRDVYCGRCGAQFG